MDENRRAGVSDLGLEYEALRAEILKRIELRQQLAAIALTAAGVFLGIGIANPPVALVYPVLAAALVAGWAQNDVRITDIATYIRTEVEPKLGYGWEAHVHKARTDPERRTLRRTVISHGAVFFFTQLAAIAVGLSRFGGTKLEWFLVVFDVIAVVVVVYEVQKVRLKRARAT